MVTPLQTLDNWLHGRSANDCGPPRRTTSRGDVVYEYDKSRTGLNPQRVIFRQSQDPRGGQHHVYARYTGPIGTPDHLAFNRMCDRRKNGLPYTFSTSSGRSSESGSLSGRGSGGGRDLGRAGSEHSSRVSSGSKRQESVHSSTRSSHSASSKGSTLGSQTSLAELSKPTIPAHTKPPIISMQTVGATTEGAYRFPPFPAFPPMPEFPAFPALPRHP